MVDKINNSNRLFDIANLIEFEKSKTGILGAYQLPMPVVFEENAYITIPRGFSRDGSKPVTWETSIDRHTLKAVPYAVSVPASILIEEDTNTVKTMITMYQVRLMGVLYYNVVLGNFTAKSVAYSNGRAVFATKGAIAVNMVLGYVADMCNIRPDLLDNTVFDVVYSRPNLAKNGEKTTYDPANSGAFYTEFDGSTNMVFNLPFSVFMTVNPVIS